MKVKILMFFLSLGCFSNVVVAQKIKKIAKLPEVLNEISGICFMNDSVMVVHNDSGNDPILYFLNLKGERIHQVEVENAKNNDWEDITCDRKGYLYIGDVGNNSNTRKKLHIYKVPTWNILKKEKVKAEDIEFQYAEQTDFPPAESDLHFDSEAIAYYKDSIHIFTKCRTKPFDGKSYRYVVSTKPGKYTLTKRSEIYLGKNGFFKDAITSAEICGKKCYLLTYNRIIVYSMKNGGFEFKEKIYLKPYSQKEAIATIDNKTIYIADEKQKMLGGPNLYKLKLNP
jgi:hypothetical protein